MDCKECEQLLALVEDLRTKAYGLGKVFPNGLPIGIEELEGTEQEKACRDFDEAWIALSIFRKNHPSLGVSLE